MAEPRRQTKSAGAWRHEQSDAQLWSNQPDPVLIERGQTEAIQLVRNSMKPTMTMTTHTAAAANSSTSQHSEPNTMNTSRLPSMVFVGDEQLKEQFLTGDEAS